MSNNNHLLGSGQSSRRVWFKLIDANTGQMYTGTSPTSVYIESTADVDTFRKQVRLEASDVLSHIQSLRLQVYENDDAFNKRRANGGENEPLSPGSLLGSFGETCENPIIVVVPSVMDLNLKRPRNLDFEYCGNIPSTLRSVDDLLALIDDDCADDRLRISREVFRDGEARWNNLEPQFVTLPFNLVRDAGIAELNSQDVVLYFRERCFQQLKFLNRFVIVQKRLGRIYGHPGTGKSITALYFALDLSMKKLWNVLWVHLSRCGYVCLHMKPGGSVSRAVVLSDEVLTQYIQNFHNTVDVETSDHAVFVDGVNDHDNSVVKEADRWNMGNPHNRRVVFVYSEGVPKKFNQRQAAKGDQAIFRQWSCTLDEYKIALRDSMHRSRAVLDATHDLIDDPVDCKYFYAGGCARYMFDFPTDVVKEHIADGINEHARAVYNGPVDSAFSPASIHRLFAYFGPGRTAIISDFAKTKMLENFGRDELIGLAKHPFLKENNSTVGTSFEIFFKLITTETRAIHFNPGVKLNVEGVVSVYIPSLTHVNCPIDKMIWPMCKQQPTFDALIVRDVRRNRRSLRTVEFIQVTTGESHPIDLEVLRKLMVQLRAQGAEFFLVRPSSQAKPVHLYPVLNPNSMRHYQWPVVIDEIRKHVKQVTVDGWEV